MDWEELEPRQTAPRPRDLDALSIRELEDYIAELEAEIARARAKIRAKQAHQAGAAGLFRKG
ncbi:MAG: DUF1192 domain-containing protein [Rhodospirillaceae bacterium]|nr:DUF1192 domain-containing protein [Rhodospirillaceae bacterium]